MKLTALARIVALALVLLAMPLAASGPQPGKVSRFGMLLHAPAQPDHSLEAFRQGLRALGWV